MAKQQNPLRSIYNDLGLEQAGIGYDKFSTKFMADSNARRSVYNDLGLEQAGVDYDLFEERLGVKKKELSQSASQSGLGTSGQPSVPSLQIDSVGAETPVAEEPQNLAQVDTSAFVSLTPEEMQAYGYDEEGRTTWSEVGQSMANSIKNVGTRLKGFDERFRVLAGQGLERIIGEDAARQFAAHSALYNPQMSFLLFGNMPTVKLSVASAYEELDRLSGEMLETQGLLENIRSGDPLGFLAGSVDAISALASTAIVSAPTAGAGLFIDMMGESIYEFNNQVAENRGVSAAQLYLDGEADYVVPAAIGLVGGALEKIGFKGAANAVIGKLTGPMVRKAVSMGLGANKEGVTEWLQTGLEAVNIAIANGDRSVDSLSKVLVDALFSDEGLEAYLMGAVGTMGAAGISRTAQYAVGKTNRDKANTSSENIYSLSEELNNENLSPAAREAIQQEIERSTRDLAGAVSESAEILDNASPEVKAEVGDLMSRLDQIQAIIHDPSISESVKDSFAAQAEQLASEIDSLISESEAELSERRARQEEVDQAILSFQEANPGIEVDYMEDLPDSVVTTFDRVESGLPTDPTAIDEASAWMYNKYKELSDLKNDPNRRLTIEQIEGIQEQLGEDITLLENYKLEQYGERTESTQVQPETTIDTIADQAVEGQAQEAEITRSETLSAQEDVIAPTQEESPAETPADASTESSFVIEESQAQPGQYFTRDIGGEQTVYRRNEDGTASIVPDSEAQNILSQQTEQGQSIATERESLPVAESTAAPTEIAVAYAPLREHNVTTSEEDQSVRDTASYKAFESLVDESAKALGIPVNNRRNTWGGYVDGETGRPVQEVSNVMTITGTPEQARLLAAVIGQNAPEMQDSVLVGNYSPDGQGSEYVISVGSFENAQKNLPLLKENGIEYFTLDKDTGDIIILDLDGGLSDNINGLIEKLKENGDYTGLQAQRTNAEFIGQNDYGRIIEEARRNPGQQNWSDLDAAIERAKRSYADKSNRPVKSGSPELGESRGDRTGRSETGQTKKLEGAPTVEGATGPDPVLNEVARKYAESIGVDFNRQTEYVVVDVDRAKRIAKAYDEMEHNPSDPAVKEAYENLIRQTKAQYDALSEAGYVFYFYDETNDPYNGNPWEAMRDLRGNKEMAVFATEAGYGSSATDIDVSDNPLLQDTGIEWGYGSPSGPKKKVTANDLFRAVHDAFGHGLEGAGFRARGEENAWQAHARLFTGSAIGALTTETRGQNSWLNFGPYGEQNRNAKVEDTIFADQKTGLMPEWTWKEGFDGIQYDTPSVSTSEKKDPPSSKTKKPRTPKTLLKGISDKLAGTGLATSVKTATSAEITKNLGVNGENVNGYIDGDGAIVINSEKATLDTPIHEFAHAWEQKVEKDNPSLHAKGMALIKSDDGKAYVDHVKKTQPGLKGDALYKEAMAQAIGDKGARIIGSQKKARIKDWLDAVWNYIADMVGISGMTADQISNLSLTEFTDAVAVDLLAGKPVNTLPNGDIVVATEAVSREEMSESEKRVSDFIERMRNKNNIRFQGEIDSESDALSQSDLVEFMTVAGDLARLDKIRNLSDLKAFANSIGITNAGDINAAWSAAQDFVGNPRSTSAFKKADIRKEFAGAPFEKMSDAEYIEIGKRMVDEGFINPDALTADIIENPRVLQTHETPAMTYGKRRLENRIAENRAALKKDPTNVDLRIEADALWSLMKDYDLATAITAYHWGKSGRLRDLTLDKEYTQVQALVEMEQYGEVSAETRARLDDLGRQLNEAKADLINKAKEIEALKEAQGQAGINSTAQAKPVNRPRTNRATRQAALEVLDGLDLSRFGVASPNFQTNGVVRFSVTANDRLSRALGAAVATMRAQVESGKVRIEEAVETAINAVNSEVGENGWSPVAFRSEIINAYSEKGYVAKPSKPYVGRDGKPVVPGEYLIGLVSAHRSETGTDMTIDQMVEAAQADLGPSFSERDIRDSISGYGRASANRLSDDRKNINTAKTIGRLQSRLEDLQNLGYSPNSRQARARQVTEEIKDIRKAIQDLIDSLEDSPDYKSQMSQALENKKKYIEEYIKDVELRIKTYQDANASGERVPEGYFSKTPKYDFTSDPDIIALERRREEARNKLKEEVFRHRLEHRGTLERAVDVTEQVLFNTTRMLTAGADLSAVLVQGGFITMSDPAMSYRAFKNSVSKAGNKDLYEAYYLDLQSKPLFEAARKAKLNMQLPSFYESIQEEQFGRQNPITHAWDYIMDKTFGKDSKAAKKAKDGFPYAAAERQYAMYLTEIRFEMFNKAVNDAINHFGIDVNSEVGQQKLRTIASGVNDLTMASNIRGLDPGSLPARIGNVLLFSMRKLAASWKLMLKMPYYAGAYTLNKGAKYAGAMGITNAARLKNQTDMSAFMFQKMYGKYGGTAMGSVAAITLIPTLIANGIYDPEDEEEEMPKMYNPNILNPVHSDFMKLRWGNTRIDLTLGIGGNTVLVSRLINGGYMTSSSPVFREFDQSVSGFRNSGAWDIFTQYAKNKLAPTPSIAFNKVFGTDFEKAQAGDRITESLYPMWLSGTIEQYQDTGEIGSTIALFGLSMLGLANNTYGGVEFADHRGTDNAEARKIFERLLISDTTPTRRAKQMYSPSDEGTAQLQDSGFLEGYQEDYNEYMTQATISRKPIITNRRLHPEKVNSLVNNMKARANKYAEVKNTGIYLDEDFRKVTNRQNETFKLTNAQISQKANILIRTMGSEKFQRFMPQLRKAAEKNMKADGLNPTKDMIEMEAFLSLYNSAHAEASRQMTLIVNKGNMTLVPEDEYNSRADVKGEYDE